MIGLAVDVRPSPPSPAAFLTPVLPETVAAGEALFRALGCGACHTGVPEPAGPIGPSLSARDPARDPTETFVYLREAPHVSSAGPARMPSFHLDDAEALALSLYLAAARPARGETRRAFDAARRSNRDIVDDDGARIFRALGCAACHPHAGEPARKNGPPLAGAASRLSPNALRDFLLRPHAVRPFGFRPGSGGRMPDYGLTEAEVDSIITFLNALETPIEAVALEPVELTPITPFGGTKARALLDTQLSCLGCHALDGQGGRIGPDLGRAGERLAPGYLAAIVRDPQHAMPGTVMPRAPMVTATSDLILAFLAAGAPDPVAGERQAAPGERVEPTRGGPDEPARGERAGYLSLITHAVTQTSDAAEPAAQLYATRCAACHGPEGQGDGYNAAYLRVRPTAHADAQAMERRPDDTLYDGIHAGAAILGGSVEMPAFGESLSPDEIRGLVGYVRVLCNCRQPSWAGDGSGRR